MAQIKISAHKVASMTVFCNEDFRINAWKRYYNEYKDNIDVHVIINNGSKNYTDILKKHFPDSVILECESSNLLSAYNVGFDYILSNTDVDAIMQITNDVRFEQNAIKNMVSILFSNPEIGVVGPTLLKKDSNIVESFGWILKGKMGFGYPLYINKKNMFG